MRQGRTCIVAVVFAVSLAVVVSAAAGCGGDTGASGSPAATTPMGKARQILGHDPTGLARTIVESGSVTVADDANYAPQSSIDKTTGKLVGFDVDVADKVGELLGLTVKFKNPAWQAVIPGLQARKWDVSIGSMPSSGPDGAARRKLVDFTGPYYYTLGQVFARKGGQPITGPQDLDGKTVGVGAGTSYYTYLTQKTTAVVKLYTSAAEAFPDLVNGKLDYVMADGPTGQQAISEGQPIEFSGPPLFYEDLSFAIKKGEPDWLALLNYAVRQMHKDGSLSTMSKKWYNGLDLSVKQ